MADDLIVNPQLNLPIQEMFPEFQKLVPKGGQFNVRPLAFQNRLTPASPKPEGEAHPFFQQRFDPALKDVLSGMNRQSLRGLALQVFNADSAKTGRFFKGSEIDQIPDARLRELLWKNMIITTVEEES